jgi:hypothetical protein
MSRYIFLDLVFKIPFKVPKIISAHYKSNNELSDRSTLSADYLISSAGGIKNQSYSVLRAEKAAIMTRFTAYKQPKINNGHQSRVGGAAVRSSLLLSEYPAH